MNRFTKIPYLTILFRNNLKLYEIPAFRGAIISKIPDNLVLFHNHLDEGFRFSYPLIQYKTIGGKAALFCIGEGTREVASFFEESDFLLRIGDREESFSVENVWANQWLLQTWEDSFHYSMRRWLPLNKANYELYSATEEGIERNRLLESVLIGNLLSMSKGLGHFYESDVTCTITDIDNTRFYSHKKVRLQGFDIRFKTNVFLPDFIGLGKGASMGFGIVKSIKVQNQEQ